jgi:hypothetical protein
MAKTESSPGSNARSIRPGSSKSVDKAWDLISEARNTLSEFAATKITVITISVARKYLIFKYLVIKIPFFFQNNFDGNE